MNFLRNTLQSSWEWHLPRIHNWLSRGNSPETPTYTGLMRSPVRPLDSLGPQCIEGAPTSFLVLDLVVTSSRSQWLCWMVTAERVWLPFNDFCLGCRSAKEEETVICFLCQCLILLRDADIGYFAFRPLSAWRSYRPLMSRVYPRLSSFMAAFPVWGSR